MKKIFTLFVFTITLILFSVTLSLSRSYYVSPSGIDDPNGGSITNPLQTLTYAGNIAVTNDSILLIATVPFNGSLSLNSVDNIYIGGYNGTATINSGTATSGIVTWNCNNITIENINVNGNSGNAYSEGISIWFGDEIPGHDVKINNCQAQGYGNGIAVSNYQNAPLNYVTITNCTAQFCTGASGIIVWDGYFGLTAPNISNVLIASCKSLNNPGGGFTDNWSGSGIFCCYCKSVNIYACEAGFNGQSSASAAGGAVGIWLAQSDGFTVISCHSHDNMSTTTDGGGFDADGGCKNGSFFACNSDNNYGPAFLICEYDTAKTENITVRRCTSYNDGNGRYPGIYLYTAGTMPAMDNIVIDSCYINQLADSCIGLHGKATNVTVTYNNFCIHPPAVLGSIPGAKIYNNFFPCLALALDTTQPYRPPVAPKGTYLKAYPNPAVSTINFTVNEESHGKYEFQVMDMNGKLIYSSPIVITGEKTFSFNINNYSSGAYVGLIRNEYGIKAKRVFIKQ